MNLFRHGIRLQLEGGYFDVYQYLKALSKPCLATSTGRALTTGWSEHPKAAVAMEIYTPQHQQGVHPWLSSMSAGRDPAFCLPILALAGLWGPARAAGPGRGAAGSHHAPGGDPVRRRVSPRRPVCPGYRASSWEQGPPWRCSTVKARVSQQVNGFRLVGISADSVVLEKRANARH